MENSEAQRTYPKERRVLCVRACVNETNKFDGYKNKYLINRLKHTQRTHAHP
jgi:hypothetical protein